MAMTAKQQALNRFDPTDRRGRPDYGSGKITEQLQPRAAPIDSFVQAPQIPAGPSQTEQLVRALAPLSSQLQGLIGDMRDRAEKDQAETDKIEGERRFIEGNQQGFVEAVRQDPSLANRSPVFRRAFQEAEGVALARRASSEIEQEYQQWEGRERATPDQLAGWLADRVRTRFEGASANTLRTALPTIRELQNRISGRNATEVGNRVYADAVETAKGDVRTVLQQALSPQGASETDPNGVIRFNPTQVAREVENITTRLRNAGVSGQDLNKAIVDEVTAVAIQKNDPRILEVLQRDRSNGTPGAGLTTYGRDRIERAEEVIFRNSERLENVATRRLERERREAYRVAVRNVTSTLMGNPEADISEDLIRLGSQHDPDFALKVENMRKTVRERAESDNPADIRDAQVRIFQSERPTSQIFEEVANGNIRNPATMRQLFNDASRLEQARNRGESGSASLEIYRSVRSAIVGRLTDPGIADQNTARAQAGGSRAVLDFDLAVAEWDSRNPEATRIERIEAVNRIGKVITDSITPQRQYSPVDMQAVTTRQADSAATQQGDRRFTRPSPQGVEQRTPISLPTEVVDSPGDANLPAGMRNNNPGNIKFIPNPTVPYQGVLGPSRNTDQGDPQMVFRTPEDGMRATVMLAQRKYERGLTTAEQLITAQDGWTPGNTAAAANIARMMGVRPDEDLRLGEPARMERFVRALVTQEHGESSRAYGDQMIRDAVRTVGQQRVQAQQPPAPGSAVQWMEGRLGEMMRGATETTRVPSGRTIGDIFSRGRINHQQLAEEFVGSREATHAAVLSEFFRKAAGVSIDPRQTAWCAAFANAVLGASGLPTTDQPLLARSFLQYGEDATERPTRGDIAVFRRGTQAWQGHVGFYQGEVVRNGQRFILVLGGNQSNGVTVREYPAGDLLGIRRPVPGTQGPQQQQQPQRQ